VPAGLSEPGHRFWREITRVYELAPGEVETLRQCCRLVDLIDTADTQLTDEGLTVAGSRGQPRAHPLLEAVDEMRRTLDGLMRSLALPMPDEQVGSRRSPQQVAAAQSRWRARRAG
jgi:hypothetical protein